MERGPSDPATGINPAAIDLRPAQSGVASSASSAGPQGTILVGFTVG